MDAGSFGFLGFASILAILEMVLRISTYVAVIFLCVKGVKALNVFINKNK